MIVRAVLIAVLTLAVSPAHARSPSVDQLAWLQGCWESASGQRVIEERWMAPRGGAMIGVSRTISNDRMSEYELMVIAATTDALTFTAHPSGQAAAVFTAQSATATGVVFENPTHDFPQRVSYRRAGADRLQAWIDGSMNGASRRVGFSYRRVPCEQGR
jgi:hypothetical protein